MRMRNHNCVNATKILDALDGVIIDIRDAVPKNIARSATEQECSLADGDLRFCVNAYDARMILVVLEDVRILLRLLQVAEGCPGLTMTGQSYVLVRLLAWCFLEAFEHGKRTVLTLLLARIGVDRRILCTTSWRACHTERRRYCKSVDPWRCVVRC